MAELVQTANGTFITRAEAEAIGLELPHRKVVRKVTAKPKSTAKRKTAGATRKGK